MKNLIKFELRKILTKRFAVISVAAVLLLSLILSFSTLHSMYAFDGNGTEETGKAAVEIDKQIALKYEGKLTDNKVQQMMSEFKPTQDLHGIRKDCFAGIRLCCVGYAALHITFPYKFMEVVR